MRYTIIILIYLISYKSFGQDDNKRSFENLTTIKIGEVDPKIIESISFDSSISQIINKTYDQLDKNDPFYRDACDGRYIKLIRTKINRYSDKYYVISYNPSCCCDYGFIIYEDDPEKVIGEITADRLFIPGNGGIYSDGRMWRNFNKRQKFIIQNDTIHEIEQPFNYVGLISSALSNIKIYEDKELTKYIATISKGYEIEVLLNDRDQIDLYLVKTSFGLVGWTRLEAQQYKSVDVEGIYYWGD